VQQCERPWHKMSEILRINQPVWVNVPKGDRECGGNKRGDEEKQSYEGHVHRDKVKVNTGDLDRHEDWLGLGS
jgi:hypothetical protein